MTADTRAALDHLDTIATYAQEISEFLMGSELTQCRALIETVREADRGGARQRSYALHDSDATIAGYPAECRGNGAERLSSTIKKWWALYRSTEMAEGRA